MSMIQALLSRTKGTIATRRQQGIDWHLETAVGEAGDDILLLLCKADRRYGWHFSSCGAASPLFGTFWSFLVVIIGEPCASSRREKEGEMAGERKIRMGRGSFADEPTENNRGAGKGCLWEEDE